jgi:hypothetical protein
MLLLHACNDRELGRREGWGFRPCLTLEDSDGSWEVVNTSSSLEGSNDDGWGWDQIVRESVVEVALKLEDVLDRVELLLVAR